MVSLTAQEPLDILANSPDDEPHGPVRNPCGHYESLRDLEPYPRVRHLPDVGWRPKKARDAMREQLHYLASTGQVDADMLSWVDTVTWLYSDDELTDCFPSHKSIGHTAQRSKSWSQRTLKKLRALGIVAVEHRFLPQRDGSIKATSNKYRFLFLDQFRDMREARRVAKISATQRSNWTRRTNGRVPRPADSVQPVDEQSASDIEHADVTNEVDHHEQARISRMILEGATPPETANPPPS